MKIQIKNEHRVVSGHVSDVSKQPLERALRRYDEQLYLKWDTKCGVWQLRRKPEMKFAYEGYSIDTPRGLVGVPGDIFDCSDFGLGTIVFPKYKETKHDIVKEFSHLDYRILDWVAKQDLWKFGYKGKDFATDSAYLEAKYEEKIDEDSYAEKAYGLRQMKTQINDFRSYVLNGGDPYRLLDYWK